MVSKKSNWVPCAGWADRTGWNDACIIHTGTVDADRLPNVEDLNYVDPFTLPQIPNLDWAHISTIFPRARADLISDWPSTFPPEAHHDHHENGGSDEVSLDASQIVSNTLDPARVPNLDTSKITTGTFSLTRIPNMDDAHIPNLETLSYGAAFAEAQIPHSWDNTFWCKADYIGVGDLANLLYKKAGSYAFINQPLVLQGGLSIGGASGGGAPAWGGTEVISSARALANVTANASIINAGTFAEAQIPHTFANSVEFTSGITIGGDVNLYRSAANKLRTDDTLDLVNQITFTRSSASDINQLSLVSGDSVGRLSILADGKHEWGAGGVESRDTNLYRSAADTLKTDDSLFIAGNRIMGHQDTAIVANAITAVAEYVTISGAGTLKTINGGVDGMTITIMANGTYTINIEQDTGNINLCLSSGTGIQLINTKSFLRLVYRSAYDKWQSLGYFASLY